MKLIRKVGATSQIFQIFIANNNVTTGAGLTGLVFNSSGLTAYFHRDTDTTATAISLVTMTVGTYQSGGFKEIDATNMPGWYQFCPPNAALASGAASVGLHLKGATNMADLPIEVDLDAQVDVALWNGTAVSSPATAGIPDVNVKNMNNVAATPITTIGASVGTTQPLNFSGTGASALVKSDTEQLNAQAVTAAAGVTFPSSVASPTNITAGTITTATNLTNAPTAGDFTAAVKASLNAATPASITGAVGSVAGNIGGNVVGSVGSVVSFGTLVADVAAAVWAAGTRTLTGFGSLVSDVAAAVWAAGSRTLTSFGFTVTTDISGLVATNLDTTVSSRLASASYTTPPTTAQNADALLARNIEGGSNGGRTVTSALQPLRNKVTSAAGTLTVYAQDDTTVSWTSALTTDPAANPIVSSDPA